MEHAVFWWSCFPEEARTFGGDCCRRNSPCDVHATCSADGSRKDARSGVDHTPDGDALVFHCCNHDDVFGYRGSASVGVQLHLCQVHRPLSLHVSAQASCWHHFRHDFLCSWSSSRELHQQWWWWALPTKCRKFFFPGVSLECSRLLIKLSSSSSICLFVCLLMAMWACGRFLISMNAIVCAYSMAQLLHTILLLMSGKAFPQPVVSLGVLTYTCDQVSHWAAVLTSITIMSTISDPWCVVPIWFKVLHSFHRIPPHKWSSQTCFSHCCLYRGKPWQQGITPTNQGQNPQVNGVMLCCQGFPMYKNHMAGVPASKVDTMFL